MIKIMSDKDFLLTEDDFSDKSDPFSIPDVKKATYTQLKEVMVIQDYSFCSLLQTSRLSSLDPSQTNIDSRI